MREFNPFAPKFKKYILPTFQREMYKWSSERIGSIIIFHLSKPWKTKFFILCYVVFLVRLQRKFEIDHSSLGSGRVKAIVRERDQLVRFHDLRRFDLNHLGLGRFNPDVWLLLQSIKRWTASVVIPLNDRNISRILWRYPHTLPIDLTLTLTQSQPNPKPNPGVGRNVPRILDWFRTTQVISDIAIGRPVVFPSSSIFTRLDFRRSLVSGLRSWKDRSLTFPTVRLVTEPRCWRQKNTHFETRSEYDTVWRFSRIEREPVRTQTLTQLSQLIQSVACSHLMRCKQAERAWD